MKRIHICIRSWDAWYDQGLSASMRSSKPGSGISLEREYDQRRPGQGKEGTASFGYRVVTGEHLSGSASSGSPFVWVEGGREMVRPLFPTRLEQWLGREGRYLKGLEC